MVDFSFHTDIRTFYEIAVTVKMQDQNLKAIQFV